MNPENVQVIFRECEGNIRTLIFTFAPSPSTTQGVRVLKCLLNLHAMKGRSTFKTGAAIVKTSFQHHGKVRLPWAPLEKYLCH